MMTNEQIWHMLLAFFLWLITFELFPTKYLYTRSEIEIFRRGGADDGLFSTAAITKITSYMIGMAIVMFGIVKYIY